jgi:drug/metabolite transporter (DMT)-like permease
MTTKASVVAVIFSCNPMFVVPLAALVLRERITPRTIASLAASLVGIAFIASPAFKGGDAGASAVGIGLTVLSALVFSIYGVLGKAKSSRYGGVALTCFTFLAGCAELLAVIGISHIAPFASAMSGAGLSSFAAIPVFSGITLQALPSLLYIGVGVTGLGYAFYLLGMETTSAQTGSIVFFIKPALSPILSLLVLGESIGLEMGVGIAFILAGAGVALVKKR